MLGARVRTCACVHVVGFVLRTYACVHVVGLGTLRGWQIWARTAEKGKVRQIRLQIRFRTVVKVGKCCRVPVAYVRLCSCCRVRTVVKVDKLGLGPSSRLTN